MEAKISLANFPPLSKGPIKRKQSKSEKIRRKIMRRKRKREGQQVVESKSKKEYEGMTNLSYNFFTLGDVYF